MPADNKRRGQRPLLTGPPVARVSFKARKGSRPLLTGPGSASVVSDRPLGRSRLLPQTVGHLLLTGPSLPKKVAVPSGRTTSRPAPLLASNAPALDTAGALQWSTAWIPTLKSLDQIEHL
eukprot:2214313-Rhodomonas_salina.1